MLSTFSSAGTYFQSSEHISEPKPSHLSDSKQDRYDRNIALAASYSSATKFGSNTPIHIEDECLHIVNVD
ncbi:hypothetical protein GJ496_010989 [Pomphorhynchus laevis]|nr:hypothetical protein GJ496_010989 [Pomphorhynchus laevis]